MFAMASASTNAFAIGATVLGGLLAGPAVNRVLVELPAWALDRKRNLLEARNGELCDPQLNDGIGWH
jgi:hypothetical protein